MIAQKTDNVKGKERKKATARGGLPWQRYKGVYRMGEGSELHFLRRFYHNSLDKSRQKGYNKRTNIGFLGGEMTFYEDQHDFDANYLFWGDGINFSYPFHLHRCPEVLTVLEGEMVAAVGDKEYTLSAGDCLVVWSNQAHEYRTAKKSRHELCVFAPELAPRFFLAHTGETPTDPVIRKDKGSLIPMLVHALKDEQNVFAEKGILYYLCAEIEKNLTFEKRKKERQETSAALLTQILSHINDNYQGDCSLTAIADALRYEKTYLSKFFSRNIGITLAEYVLQLRLAHAGRLLLDGNNSIIDVGIASGFNSLRTFNRNFVDHYGVTPSQYRAQKGSEFRKRLGKRAVGGVLFLEKE